MVTALDLPLRLVGEPLGSIALRLLRLSSCKLGLALCYHGISSSPAQHGYELPPPHDIALFERELRYIARCYRVVPGDQLRNAIAHRSRGERFPLAITFDDDLRSHRRYALPSLQRLGLTATFFVCGASLERPFAFWWERLSRALALGVDVEAKLHGMPGRTSPLHPDPPEQRVFAIAQVMETLPPDERDAISDQLTAWIGPDPEDSGMRAEDIAAIVRGGSDIGFHTWRHAYLPLLDDDALHAALVEGRERIEAIAGRPIVAISYPHGGTNRRVADAARAAGYRDGYTMQAAAIDTRTEDLLRGRFVPSFRSVGALAVRLVYALVQMAARDLVAAGHAGRRSGEDSRQPRLRRRPAAGTVPDEALAATAITGPAPENGAAPSAGVGGRDPTRMPDKRGLVMLCDVDLGFPDATRTHTVEVARGFALAGFDVDLVARGPDQRIDGVRYAPASGGEHDRLVRLLTINARTIQLLWKRRRTAERFYVREKWACTPSVIAARLLGYHVVTQVDGFYYGPGQPLVLGYVQLVLVALIGRLSHGVLAVTPELKQLLVRYARVPAERVKVIPNGVDIEFFVPLDRREAIARAGLEPGHPYVIFCGGFHTWTDFDMLLNAFARVVAARPDARLLLVGDGPERKRIERLRRQLGLEDVSIMTGRVHDRKRVRDYIAASTVALLLYRPGSVTRTSASPVKLNEYLAAGRAVVAIDIPGVREYVEQPQAGRVVRHDTGAVAGAILELLDPEQADRFGAAGRRFAEGRLSWRRVLDRTLPLFRI